MRGVGGRAGVPVVEFVTDDLRLRLLSGNLAPGAPLGEVDVAEQYGVSRVTAKAAIENLVASRLLTRRAHATARVTVLGPDDVDDIYRTRELIESEAVRRLAQIRLVPDGVREANREIARLVDASSLQVVGPDMRLHTELVDALASQRTSVVHRGLADEIRLCMVQVQGATLLSNESIAGEHDRLLDHIAQGREGDAVDLLQEHLSRARRRLVARLHGLAGSRDSWLP